MAILPAQIALGVIGLSLLVLIPPPHGRMLLIPSTSEAAHRLVALAVSQGTLLVEEGPLPGSLVIFGDRATLLPLMLRHGILVTAAPRVGCGTRRQIRERA